MLPGRPESASSMSQAELDLTDLENGPNLISLFMKKIASLSCALFGFGAVVASADDGWFKNRELYISGFGTYIDQPEDQWGGGAEVGYFFCKYAGVGLTSSWQNFTGQFFDNLAGDVYLRLPIGDLSLAPYAIGTFGYKWETDNWFEGVGAGLEYRFTGNVGMFSDIQWEWNDNHVRDGIHVRAGLKWTF